MADSFTDSHLMWINLQRLGILPPRLISRSGYIALAELGPQEPQYIGSTVYMVIDFQQYISVIYGQLIKTIKRWTWFIIGWILYMVIAFQQYFSHMWTIEGWTCYTKKLTLFSDQSHHTFTIKTFCSGLKYVKKKTTKKILVTKVNILGCEKTSLF